MLAAKPGMARLGPEREKPGPPDADYLPGTDSLKGSDSFTIEGSEAVGEATLGSVEHDAAKSSKIAFDSSDVQTDSTAPLSVDSATPTQSDGQGTMPAEMDRGMSGEPSNASVGVHSHHSEGLHDQHSALRDLLTQRFPSGATKDEIREFLEELCDSHTVEDGLTLLHALILEHGTEQQTVSNIIKPKRSFIRIWPIFRSMSTSSSKA